MNELDAFPFRVEVWSDDDQRVDEILGALKNVTLGQAAYRAALVERPGKILRLRIRARVIEEFIPAPPELPLARGFRGTWTPQLGLARVPSVSQAYWLRILAAEGPTSRIGRGVHTANDCRRLGWTVFVDDSLEQLTESGRAALARYDKAD